MTPEALRSLVASNIRRLAAERGMPLNSLADFAGISRSQLYVLLGAREGGTLGLVARISEALGVEPWELLKPDG